MHLPVLLLATASALGLAFPSSTIGTKSTSVATCNTQAFQAIGFETFQAPPGPRDPSSPQAFGASHISFLFIDSNVGTYASCSRFLKAGAGGSVDDAKNYYSCGKTRDGSLVEFLYGGKQLGLKHSFNCNGVNVTTSGTKDIKSSLYCFEANPGISCNKEDLDEISIPITKTKQGNRCHAGLT